MEGREIMLRREALASIAALAAIPSMSWADEPGLQLGAGNAFDSSTVADRARALAAQPYAPAL